MRKLLLPVSLFALILSSCTNADPKKMAAAVCDCMDPALGNLSSKAKKIINKAFKDGDVQNIVQQELQAIEDDEQRTKIANEITKAGKKMQGKKMKDCLNDIDKKYNVEEKQKEILAELRDQCETGAYIFKYGLDQKDNTAKDDKETIEEETDRPKKRRVTEEEQ
jgi:hypothetical protein